MTKNNNDFGRDASHHVSTEMKIGFDAKRLFENHTGLGNYSRTLVQNLATHYPENQYELFAPRAVQHIDTAPFFQSPFQPHFSQHLSKNWWRTSAMTHDLRRENIQIYHGLSHELPLGIQKTGIKSVVTIHDIIFKRFPNQFPLFQRLLYDFKWKYACENADAIVAISEHTKQDIIEYYNISPQKIHVIYQACDERFLARCSADKLQEIRKKYNLPSEYLLYVGSVIERKNVLNLVKSLHFLPKDVQIPLVIVGSGKQYMREIQQYIAENAVEKRVFWRKNISNEDLPAIYQGAAVFIYPSLYEGFGIPLIEAACSKVPIVTNRASSLPEAAGEFAAYSNVHFPQSIAETVEKLLKNTKYQQLNVENSYNYVQRFRGEIVTNELMNLYKSLQFASQVT
jgi:glycosyltransferase involved in cell wall biosynthesis